MPIKTKKSVYTYDWVNYFSPYLSLIMEKNCVNLSVIVNNKA